MRILILEDDLSKREIILSEMESCLSDIDFNTEEVNNLSDFISSVSKNKYDLIVFDIVVPLFSDEEFSKPENIIQRSIKYFRSPTSLNNRTPVIAITSYVDLDQKDYELLNNNDVNVVKYSQSDWKKAFSKKIDLCKPELKYDFVIICALESEASAYNTLGYSVSETFHHKGLYCRDIKIADHKGVLVLPSNMGLVQSAIASAKSIEMFSPKLITMSGICAGIPGKSKIYDIIIPKTCDQHDVGKWTESKFIFDSYSTSLDHEVMNNIKAIIDKPTFKNDVKSKIIPTKSELPSETFDFDISLGILSSGSSVVANKEKASEIANQHRKKEAFEMEIYSLYEAAKQSSSKPIFFSAKSVVDDGSNEKSDDFHRVATLISAKTVSLLIEQLLN